MLNNDVDNEIHTWQSLETEEHNNQELYLEIEGLMKVLKDKEEELYQIEKIDIESSHNFDSFIQDAHMQEQLNKKANETKKTRNILEEVYKKGSKSKNEWEQKF